MDGYCSHSLSSVQKNNDEYIAPTSAVSWSCVATSSKMDQTNLTANVTDRYGPSLDVVHSVPRSSLSLNRISNKSFGTSSDGDARQLEMQTGRAHIHE
ncbi:hypothetical protein AB6A40_008401 [Gnathostoma spinigerum]|uniref:Uncharacterized protein n=1 Tax=Gnathostoma spinigerum TaxID=75299 RepID=A0ABD6EYB9_9BILA